MGIKPLLFSHVPNRFAILYIRYYILFNSYKYIAINILSKTGEIPSFIAFYKLFLSDIKIKTLINSWQFFPDDFFGCALCVPSIDTLSFQ